MPAINLENSVLDKSVKPTLNAQKADRLCIQDYQKVKDYKKRKTYIVHNYDIM